MGPLIDQSLNLWHNPSIITTQKAMMETSKPVSLSETPRMV